MQEFKIGLIMAGAVSAGAYTAGAISFLFEALEKWEKAKTENQSIPSHKAKIKVMSGASAGGMCVAMTAVCICKGTMQPLYDSWVTDIDIKQLLSNDDISPDGGLKSVLNSRIIAEIAEKVIHIKVEDSHWQDFLDDKIDLYLSVTNLNGIAYEIGFEKVENSIYKLINHRDYVHFRMLKPNLKRSENLSSGVQLLQCNDMEDDWEYLKEVALATGAFPVALESRLVSMTKEGIQAKYLLGSKVDIPKKADYLCVDAGITNNEPFELTLNVLNLEEGEGKENPEKHNSAVIMIDPFPDHQGSVKSKTINQDIFSVAHQVFSALRNQSKFKPEEINLALKEDDFTRFIIAPQRTNANSDIGNHLAGSALQGFAGFFSKKFRNHDFELGRKNCQKFLLDHFQLPSSHPLFDGWRDNKELMDKYLIEGEYLPIIPLVDEINPRYQADSKINIPLWSDVKMNGVELKTLNSLLKSRIDALVQREVEYRQLGYLGKFILFLLRIFGYRKKVIDWIIKDNIQADLQKHELLDLKKKG